MALREFSRRYVGVFTYRPTFSEACEEWCHPKELDRPEGVFVHRYLLTFDGPVTANDVLMQLRDFGCYSIRLVHLPAGMM